MHARDKDVMATRVIAARADASCAGMVSESDLLARQEAPGPRRKRASTAELTAADLMSWPPALIGLSARADLVVIGRHSGHQGPGSVRHAVLNHAHGPVVTVPSA
ncbi:MAG TPA: hypothetical protein VFQ68_40645 [Streptosporangiaceae bacterium]|nr:hypothetical protein [Streptosporangiaceae bacterium]